ncbi:VWA domain-containing protein [Umezawaea sp.]|uniref:VWA domain-containing protein n=1 Tax=Umezawaea sp. TaxID=1955258 RepID=UPI002ED475A8
MVEPESPRSEAHNTLSAEHVTTSLQVGTVHGAVVGTINWFGVQVPRSVARAVITLVVVALVGAGTFAVVTWVVPLFAPTYKTEFLLDLAGSDTPDGLADSTASLAKALGNSGDQDAMALRGFGGECGAEDNTTRLVGFGEDNRAEIGEAVRGLSASGSATLVRGIVEATADFSDPLSLDATQVNRIIVVTRHGVDACDDDARFVEREVRDRVAAAGLAIEFRFVGYQLPAEHRDRLTALATAANAPPPLLAEKPADLDAALDWVANVEPGRRSAQRVVDLLNPAVAKVNDAAQAIVDGRLDVAGRTLDGVEPVTAEAEFEELRSRATTSAAVDLHARAVDLRDRQGRVVAAAVELLAAARSGAALDERLRTFREVADDYNAQVDVVNEALAALRPPGG